MEQKYDIFACGNAIVDIIIKGDDKLLEEFSMKKSGIIFLNEKKAIEILEKLKNHKNEKIRGGATANVVDTMSLLGLKTFYNGKVSNDELGKFFENELKDSKVNLNLLKGKLPTGYAITIITKDNERSFAVYLGSANRIKKDEIDIEKINKSKLLLIEGFQFYDNNLRSIMVNTAKHAKENQIKICFDLSSFNLVEDNLNSVKNFVREYVDILFCNEIEAYKFTGLEESEKALDEISRLVEIAVVKLGEKGSIIKTQGEYFQIDAIKTKVKDVNGAGDAYAAGFLFGYLKNKSIFDSGSIATKLGSLAVSIKGAKLTKELIKKIK